MASQIKMSPGIQLPEVPCELGAVALEAARLERIRQHAPELLAALESLVKHVGDHDCVVCDAARAAIRAARGE